MPIYECMCAQSCLTLCDPWTVAHQTPLSMKFSRQEYFGGLSFPSSGELSSPGIEPVSPSLPGRFFFFLLTIPLEKPVKSMNQVKLDVVKQEMARLNTDSLGISELKRMAMGEFNSDNNYISSTVGKNLLEEMEYPSLSMKVQNEVLGCNLKYDRMIMVHFHGKPTSQ